jgi:hypothetical protein
MVREPVKPPQKANARSPILVTEEGIIRERLLKEQL